MTGQTVIIILTGLTALGAVGAAYGDGKVDFLDVAVVAGHWLEGV